MKKILKSGLSFLKKDDDIFLLPSLGKGYKLNTDKSNDTWEELKLINKYHISKDFQVYNDLKHNKLVFELTDDEYEKYKLYSRNIQGLSSIKSDNPFTDFKNICNSKILIIGLGTVGSPLVEQFEKYGFTDISIVDGDIVEQHNITAQLSYKMSDIGKQKTEVISQKFKCIEKVYADYITDKNMNNILEEVRPQFVFCCADDSTNVLQNNLIKKTGQFPYTLFLTGYNLSKIFFHVVNDKTKDIFLNFYSSNLQFDDFITHNTGTIYKGFLTSSLLFEIFISIINGGGYDNFTFDLEHMYLRKDSIKTLNLTEFEFGTDFLDIFPELIFDIRNNKKVLFNCYYYSYLKSLIDTTDKRYQSITKFLDNEIKCLYNSNRSIDIFPNDYWIRKKQFENVRGKIYSQFGKFGLIDAYRHSLDNKHELDCIYKNFEGDVNKYIIPLYIPLVNIRKEKLNDQIIEYLEENFGFDFISEIYFALRDSVIYPEQLSSVDFLKLEYNTAEDYNFTNAINKIKDSINDENLSIFIDSYLKCGYIDYLPRENKTYKNVTVYNPYNKTSKIIMSFRNKITDVPILAHELVHAYFFELLKDRLSPKNFFKIQKDFWEVLAKVGELLVLQSMKQINYFYRRSHYQLNFCFLDYKIITSEEKSIQFDDILHLKDEITSFQGLDPKKLIYTNLNFINYELLYSDKMSSYQEVYADILAIAIFNLLQSNHIKWDDLIEVIKNLRCFTLTELTLTLKLDTKKLIETYTEKISHFLSHNLLEGYCK